MVYRVSGNELYHHGILGQKWGERNGPPYPLSPGDYSDSERYDRISGKSRIRYKVANMPLSERRNAEELWQTHEEIDPIVYSKSRIYSELTSNLTAEEKSRCLVDIIINDIYYLAINKGHERYKIISEDISDEIFPERY